MKFETVVNGQVFEHDAPEIIVRCDGKQQTIHLVSFLDGFHHIFAHAYASNIREGKTQIAWMKALTDAAKTFLKICGSALYYRSTVEVCTLGVLAGKGSPDQFVLRASNRKQLAASADLRTLLEMVAVV